VLGKPIRDRLGDSDENRVDQEIHSCQNVSDGFKNSVHGRLREIKARVFKLFHCQMIPAPYPVELYEIAYREPSIPSRSQFPSGQRRQAALRSLCSEHGVQPIARRPRVNKRPRLASPSLGRSIAWLADRRRGPTPINNRALDQTQEVDCSRSPPFSKTNRSRANQRGAPLNKSKSPPASRGPLPLGYIALSDARTAREAGLSATECREAKAVRLYQNPCRPPLSCSQLCGITERVPNSS
jgi:hypothetical protein